MTYSDYVHKIYTKRFAYLYQSDCQIDLILSLFSHFVVAGVRFVMGLTLLKAVLLPLEYHAECRESQKRNRLHSVVLWNWHTCAHSLCICVCWQKKDRIRHTKVAASDLSMSPMLPPLNSWTTTYGVSTRVYQDLYLSVYIFFALFEYAGCAMWFVCISLGPTIFSVYVYWFHVFRSYNVIYFFDHIKKLRLSFSLSLFHLFIQFNSIQLIQCNSFNSFSLSFLSFVRLLLSCRVPEIRTSYYRVRYTLNTTQPYLLIHN